MLPYLPKKMNHPLDHVLKFSFHLFTDESLFFHLVFENFFSSSVLIVTRLATDQGSDPFTLVRFKNKIQMYVKKRYAEALRDELRKVRFDQATARILKNARDLRVERIAHLDEKVAMGLSKGARVRFGELKTLRDQLNKVLDSLSFSIDHMMLPVQYSPLVQHPHGVDARSDIEKVLDLLARYSKLLNLPENRPDGWQRRKPNLSEHDLSVLNSYRRKFGLPDA